MSTRYLLLWFEAPLQSWGFDSKFSCRDTLDFPTKSGVLGLLCCALGAAGEQRELLACMAPLKTTVLSFSRNSKAGNHQASLPFLRDFQMVGSAYDENDDFEKQMILKNRNGGKGVGVKLTHRNYLQDRVFAVALEIPANLSDRFADSMQNPVWDLYLGRKSCAPTDFIYRGIHDTEELSLFAAHEIAKEKSLLLAFTVLDGKHQEGEPLVLNDVPIQFGPKKVYGQRYVTIVPHLLEQTADENT